MAVESESFERTFAVGEAGELVLTNISGTVEVRGWDFPDIRVSGTKRMKGFLPWVSPEEGYRATRIEMEQQGSRVTVRTTRQGEGFWNFLQWLGGVAQVDYTVRVPRRCNVVVDLVAGRLSVDEIRGNVITRTVSAGQSLRGLDGSLAVSTVSGGIVAEDLRGKAAIRTVSGAVRASRCRFASLSGRTVSGDIDVETPLDPAGSYDFQNVSATIRLALPPGAGCTAEMQSVGGSVRSELPGRVVETTRGKWQAEVNGGGPLVRVKSVSGSLLLVGAIPAALPGQAEQPRPAEPAAASAHPAAPAEPTPAGEEVSRESIMTMILEAVERGELSVDEAAARLSELDALAHRTSAQAQPAAPSQAGQGASAEPQQGQGAQGPAGESAGQGPVSG